MMLAFYVTDTPLGDLLESVVFNALLMAFRHWHHTPFHGKTEALTIAEFRK